MVWGWTWNERGDRIQHFVTFASTVFGMQISFLFVFYNEQRDKDDIL